MRAIDVAGIERVTEDYRRAATLAVEAGFDSIEVHVGHNYLLSAFLSPKLNKRDDQFGGSVENRARFARTVLRTVRDAAGSRVAVTAKLNMADGVPGGLWLDESVEVARLFEQDGALDALELTGGSSLANPMYLFRGDAPLEEFGATLPQPVRFGFRFVGGRFLRSYPYEEAFFLPFARQFLAALTSLPLILLGGITELQTVQSALAEGFAFVAMARALLREPDLRPACRRVQRRHRCASTATSACPPSTPALDASWYPARREPTERQQLTRQRAHRAHVAQAETGGRRSAHGQDLLQLAGQGEQRLLVAEAADELDADGQSLGVPVQRQGDRRLARHVEGRREGHVGGGAESGRRAALREESRRCRAGPEAHR